MKHFVDFLTNEEGWPSKRVTTAKERRNFTNFLSVPFQDELS